MGKVGRYAAAGGAISIGICILLCMALGSMVENAITIVACGVLFALPGIVAGCAWGLYEALKERRNDWENTK
ncbi:MULTISPECIES: hypothetical protein [unclassified Flavonifractor]|uniref:hypothetical protein n=1 Tax=unclassified Flavonifractor TaxID=2629267 RepID=UPI000B395A40|nr:MULTISPECIES: hypothetical protein [unclassified Flavonifractor]OUN11123.1 hypothetical protein B5G42_09375 [Flavonifractor sp. An91]OUN13581.1 hypothetical protein B5G40_00865 [Flavonifractor sp. An9]OUQ60249.1 hypothetical protein B5E56_07390 [Flavonifractor sp. An112]